MPNLTEIYDLDSEDESDEEDTYLLRNRRPFIKKEKLTKKTRTSVIFSLEDKNRNTTEYLGLLDRCSTGGLINTKLVEKYGFQCKKSTSI